MIGAARDATTKTGSKVEKNPRLNCSTINSPDVVPKNAPIRIFEIAGFFMLSSNEVLMNEDEIPPAIEIINKEESFNTYSLSICSVLSSFTPAKVNVGSEIKINKNRIVA